MNNKVSIEIFGKEYPITSAESPQYVKQLGEEIDSTLRKIMTSTAASLTESLVVVCLAYLDSYKKSEQCADHLREQVAEYLEEASEAKLELTKVKAELERLSRDHQLRID